MTAQCPHANASCRPGRSPRVRPAASTDTPAVQRLIDAIFREYGVHLLLDGPDAHLREPCGYFRGSGGEFWVLDREGEIVGTVGVILHEDGSGELKSLYVHPSIRNQGWGARLAALVMEYARSAGRRRVVLWSDTRFADAHRLYRRLGFEECGLRDLNDVFQSREFGFARAIDPASP